MAEFKIDRIRFRWTGNWQAAKQYIKDDIVAYGGKTFVCLNGHTSDPDFYIDYLNQTLPKWTQMTDGYQWVNQWTPGTYYKVNDIVRYGGQVYAAIVGHSATSYTPPSSTTTINVTVDMDTGSITDTGRANTTTGALYLNGVERNILTIDKGTTYIFDQTDATNVNFGGQQHPIAFSVYEDGDKHETPLVDYYSDGITYLIDGIEVTEATYLSGFAGASSRQVRFIVPNNAPDKLYYFNRTVNSKDKGAYLNVETPGQIGANDFGNWKLITADQNWRYEWLPQVIYRLGDCVKYGGNVYKCTTEHVSSTTVAGLEADSTKWQTVTRSDNWKDYWTPRTRYVYDDVVRYGGIIYRCITGHVSANDDALGLEEDSTKWEDLISGIDYKQHWVPSRNITVTSIGAGIVTSGAHNLANGDLVQYNTDGTDADNIDNDTYYYVRVVSATEFKLYRYYDDALADRNNLNADGGTGNQTFIKRYKYKKGDIVRYGPTMWYCTDGHNTNEVFAESFFNIWLPGYDYELEWTASETYQPGDIVKHGGYSYTALTVNTNSVPSFNGITQNTGDWELLTTGYRMGGQYNTNPDLADEASYWDIAQQYYTGDVVRFGGYLYIALRDSLGSEPDDQIQTIDVTITVGNPGSGNRYYVNGVLEGPITLIEGNTYKFIQNDSSNLTHQLYISTTQNGHHTGGQYNYVENGVTYWLDGVQVADFAAYGTGFAAATERYVQYIVPRDAYKANYLVCANHSGMYGAGVMTTQYSNNNWQTLIDGDRFRGNWSDTILVDGVNSTNNYFLGDIVTYEGTLWRCIKRHTASQSGTRPDLDVEYTNENFWTKVIQGGNNNVLQYYGDIRTHDGTDHVRLGIGNPGDSLKVDANDNLIWEAQEQTDKVYFVSPDGIDSTDTGRGLSQTAPFKTIKYATQYILADEGTRAPATILVKTGRYKEICPIKVPANVAIVGDELRSTFVEPTDETKDQDMFQVRNGCGLRNMTLSGLQGEFTAADAYLLKRVTGGAFVALDPGTGPDDTSVWVTNKSTYVQNVSTFGNKCVGMKVDGTLHNGGNKSIVANDFTQIIQDGIGYWCNADGLSELVSVFTYYCYIGYLCTDGGKVRATNGNNSYGEYGSVAVGFDQNETPISAKVNNYSKEATVSKVYNDENKLFAVGYSNTGTHYTNGTVTITGSGENAAGSITEIRNGSVTEIRITDPGDSSAAGGGGYTYANNRGQGGSTTSIQIANQDTNNETYYLNHLITIVEGEGRGQYAYITSYDWNNGGATAVSVTSGQDATLTEGTYTGVRGASSRVDATEPTFTISVDATGVVQAAITDPGTGNQVGDIITIQNAEVGGTGQNITLNVDSVTAGDKTMTVARPVDGQPGWQHHLPGETLSGAVGTDKELRPLDETTRYEITPRLTFSAPPYTANSTNLPTGSSVVASAVRTFEESNTNITRTVIVGNNTIVYSDSGTSFTEASSYQDLNYVGVASINSGWMAIDGNGRCKFSTNGQSWADAGANLLSYGLTFNNIGGGNNVLIATADSTSNIYRSTDGGQNWSQVNANVSNAKFVAYGNGKWVLANEAGDTYESIDDGVNWAAGPDIGGVQYDITDLKFGGGKFVATCFDSPNDLSTVNNAFHYSFTDAATTAGNTVWLKGEDTNVADNIYVNYQQGTWLGVTASGSIIQSDDGVYWENKGTVSGSYNGMACGVTQDGPAFYPLQTGQQASLDVITTGATTRATARVDGGKITEFIIQEPGSGYGQNSPTMTIIDNNNTKDISYNIRMANGTVGQVEFTNRGTGYINIGVTVDGDGYADLYQTGDKLIVKELSREPGPGDNLYITGINDIYYAVQSVSDLTGSAGNYTATLTITPTLDRAESPEHETDLIIRQKYSQVRLTGHDFLEIGKGNLYTSQYPLLTPIEGYDVREFQETENAGGGRVFYTSTDQDGNFRVGELFKVEQSTGIVSLNASYFELDGLSELRLGGVTLGGTNAVIKEFSTDTTFTANSNEIVPTQRAIAGYVDSRISGGGTNVNVNAVIAGEVRVQGNNITSEANRKINITTQMNFEKPVDGDMAAMAMFTGATNFGLIDEGDPTTPQEMGMGN